MNQDAKPSRIANKALLAKLCDSLRDDILSGRYPVASKLPSEAVLIESFGMSRHIVRDAISALRAEGLVQSRQGAGVFVADRSGPARPEVAGNADPTSVLELFEFRVAVETEAAALAAVRRSPAQEEEIYRRHSRFGEMLKSGRHEPGADLALHTAIAIAANNRRFFDFISGSGSPIISETDTTDDALRHLTDVHEEHGRIVAAISASDPVAAREQMRQHLVASLSRYRLLQQRA
ncbi:FadR/GntR family transcriptional regulator [Paracoccus aestuariivivens]|uniref:GntR family transcriptional regulator n=1 Tax=Paracoccus aestuariivivens TaxID=1820333 RepID=A0A6L6JCF8_9RHOB|nr:FadR/GntR family transcriptional regulator [Paracoccus aestuariivivens]MTH78409.1 GntR family transcriptional regulator [Paracoccus aestuariivivens]